MLKECLYLLAAQYTNRSVVSLTSVQSLMYVSTGLSNLCLIYPLTDSLAHVSLAHSL